MSVRLVREARKPLSKDRKHRQRYWHGKSSPAKLTHLGECDACRDWALRYVQVELF